MSDTEKSLASIEAMLVRNFTSPRDALLAAYKLGRLDGMLEVARVAERETEALLKEAA